MEENKTGEIKPRVYDMSGLRLCLYGLILTVLAAINIVKPRNQDTSGSVGLLQTTNVTYSAGIFGNVPWLVLLFLLLINHAHRSIEGKEVL